MPPATKDLRRAAESIDLTAQRAVNSMRQEADETPQMDDSIHDDQPRLTAAEGTRAQIANMLAGAGLDPRNATIEGYPHPETSGRLYRLAYDCKDGNGTVRYSDHNADPIVMARQFVEREAQSLRRNRDSVEGPLV